MSSHDVRGGDRYLLCSDGLTHMIDDDVIREAMLADEDPKATAERLVRLANEAGGRDNITVLVVLSLK